MLRLRAVTLTLVLACLAAASGEARGACGTALHDYYAARIAAERNRNDAIDTAIRKYAVAMDAATRKYAVASDTLSRDEGVAAEFEYNGTRNAAMDDYKAAMDAAMRDCFAAGIERNNHDTEAIIGPRLKRILSARNAVRKAAWDDLVADIRAARRNYEASPKTEKNRRDRDAAIDAARRDYGTALGVK